MASAEITSVELNYIIFRYLQETGFTHTPFTFGNEVGVDKFPAVGSLIPPGTLVKLVLKGLQFLEMEANLSNADQEEAYIYLDLWDILTKDEDELENIVKEKTKNQQEAKRKAKRKAKGKETGSSRHVKDDEETDIERKGFHSSFYFANIIWSSMLLVVETETIWTIMQLGPLI